MKSSYILHIGLGFFHRAHQAVYLDQLQELEQGSDHEWVLVGGNIREDNFDLMRNLKAAGGAYTLETMNSNGDCQYQTVKSIRHIVEYDKAGAELIDYATKEETKIISFTVTEAGYYLDSADNLTQTADIAEDLKICQTGGIGKTLYGALYTILKHRKYPVTLMCCDNFRHNGQRFRYGLVQFIKLLNDDTLLDWMEVNCGFPNCMVDRITPRPPSDLAERVTRKLGKPDPNAIMAEEFIQWVLEDDMKKTFVAGRPDWEKVGVEVVEDVEPYEDAKLKVLNATHSCIAWAGTLMGYDYIHEGTLDPKVRQLAYDYITDDLIPILEPSPVDLKKYRDVVLERFANAAIKDTNQRVAMDSFSKLPDFIVPTVRERLQQGLKVDKVMMLPALFFVFLQEWDSGNIQFEYHDQVMDTDVAKAIFRDSHPVRAYANDPTLWGDLAGHDEVVLQLELNSRKIREMMK